MPPTQQDNKALYWIVGAIVGWNGWLSVQMISMRSEVQAALLTHNNVIPPVVELSLGELRQRLNNEQQERAKLTELAIENRGDISRLKTDVAAFRKP